MTTLTQDSEPYAAHVLTGDSSAARKLRLQTGRIAPHFRMALLTGEAGSGQLTVARHLHRSSPVAARAFVAMHCGNLAQAAKEAVPHGTIYLYGIEALVPAAQIDLLRALKTLDRDTRVVAASQSSLKGMASTGRLRNDLYEMVGMLEIRVAPLRERQEDLELLATEMLGRLSPHASFAASALNRMRSHSWSGNLAELWTLCQELAPLGRTIEAAELPWSDASPHTAEHAVRLEDVMHRHVMDVLQGCAGNKLRAAELLGISRSTLYRMLDSSTAN